MHALLEGHEAAKASGLSQKNPVEQVRANSRRDAQHVVYICLSTLSSIGLHRTARACCLVEVELI